MKLLYQMFNILNISYYIKFVIALSIMLLYDWIVCVCVCRHTTHIYVDSEEYV